MKQSKISYKEKYRLLKPFITAEIKGDLRKSQDNFSKELTQYKKGLITKLFKAVSEKQGLIVKPVVIRSNAKNKKALLNKAHAIAHTPKGLNKYLKPIIPVPTEDTKISFKNGEIYLSNYYTKSKFILFDKLALMENPAKYLKNVVNQNATKKEKDSGRVKFKIKCGNYYINSTYTPRTVTRPVLRLMNKYGNEDKNNFWGNWLVGLEKVSYTLHRGISRDNVDDEYTKRKTANKKRVKAIKRKAIKKSKGKGKNGNKRPARKRKI